MNAKQIHLEKKVHVDKSTAELSGLYNEIKEEIRLYEIANPRLRAHEIGNKINNHLKFKELKARIESCYQNYLTSDAKVPGGFVPKELGNFNYVKLGIGEISFPNEKDIEFDLTFISNDYEVHTLEDIDNGELVEYILTYDLLKLSDIRSVSGGTIIVYSDSD